MFLAHIGRLIAEAPDFWDFCFGECAGELRGLHGSVGYFSFSAKPVVFYCERAAGFCREVCHEETGYLNALVRMFDHALRQTGHLDGKVRSNLLTRLERVQKIGRQLGYGVGDDMDLLLSEFDSAFRSSGGF